jgi:hypothetical protein
VELAGAMSDDTADTHDLYLAALADVAQAVAQLQS